MHLSRGARLVSYPDPRTRKKSLVKRVFNFGLDAANQIAERRYVTATFEKRLL